MTNVLAKCRNDRKHPYLVQGAALLYSVCVDNYVIRRPISTTALEHASRSLRWVSKTISLPANGLLVILTLSSCSAHSDATCRHAQFERTGNRYFCRRATVILKAIPNTIGLFSLEGYHLLLAYRIISQHARPLMLIVGVKCEISPQMRVRLRDIFSRTRL